jgi:uncharacterized protein YegP (UPF0339 family)
MAAKFEIKRGSSGQYRFNLKAANGEIILNSESYKENEGAKKGIESVKKNAPDDARYERKTASSGEPFFILKAANGEPIGRSELYSSQDAMENGIESVKRNAPDANIEDLSDI